VLDVTVIDALVAGLSTAFFGALVAGGAYLLKSQLTLREHVAAMDRRVHELSLAQDSMRELAGGGLEERFMGLANDSGGDALA
jgi:hypothetical protein